MTTCQGASKGPRCPLHSAAAFRNNSATTTNTDDDYTSGPGGAIYHNADGNPRTFKLTATDTSNGAVIFEGNTHNPGKGGKTPHKPT